MTLTDTGSADFYTSASYGTGTTETYTLASGTATIYVRDLVAETIQITAESDNGSIGTSANVVINPSGISYYTVTASTPQTAGEGFEGTVQAFDVNNNLVITDSSTVLTLTDTGFADFYTTASYGTGTTETYTLSGGEATIFVRDFVAETIQITAESDNGSIGTSANVVINPDVVNYYTVTAPTPQVAGTGFSGTVEGYDQHDNLVITDSSTVMTLTDTGSASFYTTASYGTGTTETYTLASGIATIYVRDLVAETILITAESDNGSIGTSADIGILPSTVGYYTFTVGTSQVAGVGFEGTLQAYDAYDNFAVNDSTTVVSLTDTGNAAFYTDGGYSTTTETYILSSGEATIYVRDLAAETIVLNAIDANSAPGTSASIGIVPNTVGYYTFTVGTSQVAGVGFTGTVQGFDAYDNFAVNDSTTVVTLTDTGNAAFYTDGGYSTATETYTLSSGETAIYVRDLYAETIVLNAVDVNNSPGTSAAISVGAATISYYTFTVATPQDAGVGFSGTLQGFDPYNNPALNDSTTVVTLTDTGNADFYTSSSYGTGTTETYTLSAGVAVIYVRDFVAETITLNAIDANAAPGTSADIVIRPVAIDHYVVNTTSPQTAGEGFIGTVTAEDQYNNTVSTDSSTVLTLTDTGSADFYTTASYGTGTTETYTLSSGITTIYVRDYVAETIQITAESDNGSIGTSANVVINPDVVNYYTVTAPTPQIAGTGFAGTVQGFDQHDNLVVNDSATVMTLTDTGSADFYTTASYGTGTTETYTLASGTATIYVRDLTAETIQITAESDNGSIAGRGRRF